MFTRPNQHSIATMALNVENARNLLQGFDFKTLFIEELGWNNPKNKAAFAFQTKEGQFYRKAISELSGATVYEITNEDGTIPDYKVRDVISKEIQKINFEHILIFIDKGRTQTIWRWLKKQEKKSLSREHYFAAGQTGDAFIAKLSGLLVDIAELEKDITITDVAKKIQNALDLEKVTKKFFKEYQQQFIVFLDLIEGIDNEADKRWYASVILDRLMFIYFLQEKGFLNNGDRDYLYSKLKETKKTFGKNQYYSTFLHKLFFEGFAKPESERKPDTNKLLGKIKYLNGGLFLQHKIEKKYPKIAIPDIAFENLLKSEDPKGLFEQFSWSLDDAPGGKDDEINPDVLGYIFEKYINQKAFGAYYTRTEITEYLCEQTIYKLILDAVNEEDVSEELLEKTGLLKPLPNKKNKSNIGLPKAKHYETVEELLIKLDAPTCKKLVVGEDAVLSNLSLLDPACGSGAFLVAAMKTLINVYAAILGKINFLGDRKLIEWKKEIEKDHPSINYYIKKKIITNNLYGVDIMEEATEIAKLRLFLALVSSAQTVDQLEPLPNIDFNIMSGNSLIGMMRVDPSQFNKHIAPSSKKPKGKVLKKENLFEPAVMMGNLFAEEHAKDYQQLIYKKETAIREYKNVQGITSEGLQELRDNIQEQEKQAITILNELLKEEFASLGIKYEQVTWDDTKNKEGKPIKRNISQIDITALEPFHWGYEFSDIFRKKDGFDAIITNPPWDVLQTDEKEFFKKFDTTIKKKKIRIEDWDERFKDFMKDADINGEWLKYASGFSYQSEYFKRSDQYKKLLSGKLNLYSLFVLQSFNLLKKGGYCGIIIPSGIYSDSNTSDLRKTLFENAQINELVGLSNEKFIFENVHHSFKFCFLTFLKGNYTSEFLSIFRITPPEAVHSDDLAWFLSEKSNFIKMPVSFIKKQSPELYAIIEVKNKLNFSITEKLISFPKLDIKLEGHWNLELGSEFNMTSHSYLFNTIKEKDSLPLYEGKMIHQFTNAWQNSETRYWIKRSEGRQAVLGRKNDDGRILGYESYRIAYRAIARPSDIRTLIATVLPPEVFCGNSLLISKGDLAIADILIPLSFLNSFVLDFYLRQMVSSNINTFYIYQLPCPRLKPLDKWYKPITERAAKLICTTDQFAALWEEIMKIKWSQKVAATNDEDRNKLRAELDGIIAHLYGLTEEEFTYILSTFPIVAALQKQAALDAYKLLAPQFKKANATEITVTDLIQKGESPALEFKSTLRVDIKTGKAEKFIEHSVIKTLAAFLNSEGGTLLIGVEDNKNILGLELDFNSFSKGDKLDEFQKHFDNLISKTLGNRFQRYLKVEFPEIDDKTICSVTIKEKSEEPVYITNDAGQETFYIRRQASTIDLKPSETVKYIKEHWK